MKSLKMTILSLSLLTIMAGAAIAPALGAINHYYSNQLLVQLVISLPALFIILSSFSFGYLCKHFSSKTIAILGTSLYIIGGCLGGISASIYFLLFSRVLLGIGVGLIMPLSTGLLSYYFEAKEQAKLMGFSSAMNSLGGVIATILSGFLVHFSWRYSFAVYAIGLLPLILVILFMPSEGPMKDKQEDSNLTSTDTVGIFPYIIGMFLFMITFFVFPTSFSIVATNAGKLSPSLIGLCMSFQNLCAFLTGLVYCNILKIFKNNIKYLSAITMLIGLFCLAKMDNAFYIFTGLLFAGIGSGLLTPLLNSQIPLKIEKTKVPAAMSLMSISLYLGQFLSPIVIKFFQSLTGIHSPTAPFSVASVIALIFTGAIIFMKADY